MLFTRCLNGFFTDIDRIWRIYFLGQDQNTVVTIAKTPRKK